LESLPKWKNYEQILLYYNILVYPRPHTNLQSSKNTLLQHEKVKLIDAPMLDISATFIRQCIQQGKSIKYLVPEDVESYIKGKKLYQE
jgi:nicotinate-nucleotide adenylyltransferase